MKQFPLKELEEEFRRRINDLSKILGNDALNFFLDSFKRQAWIGDTTEPWRVRNVKNKKDRGRALLIKTGKGKRSIRITSTGGWPVKIGTNEPYMKAHNEGFRGTVQVKAFTRNRYQSKKFGTGKFTSKGKERMMTKQSISGTVQVKAFTRKMNLPRRQYMGNSPYLTKQLQRRLLAELIKGTKKFNL